MRKILIIPCLSFLEESVRLAEKYDMGFEYNDFYSPNVLDNENLTDEIIRRYKNYSLPDYCTSHGDFFDVLVFSEDARIRKIAHERIEQSILAAKKIGASAVVFHTNHNPMLNMQSYINNWLDKNTEEFGFFLDKYPDMNIYIENMFDYSPDMLFMLAKKLSPYSNFGICYDYAHAAISPTSVEIWTKTLAPYVKHIHINDNDLKSDLHLAVGDGKIDWEEFAGYYHTLLKDATMLIETSSLENQIKSINAISEIGII